MTIAFTTVDEVYLCFGVLLVCVATSNSAKSLSTSPLSPTVRAVTLLALVHVASFSTTISCIVVLVSAVPNAVVPLSNATVVFLYWSFGASIKSN